ncbi:MAG TPA: DUF3147 family protein, partial [Kofleriaceae bacterium]
MTWPHASLAGLKKLRAWEYIARFVFGGVVTAIAGWIAKRYGLAAGGMFLAFPAILPASLTLVQQHGGRRDALDDARGGRLGAVALGCFALVVAACAERAPLALCLLAALAAWTVVAIVLW